MKQENKIIIYGGSFDPPHKAHFNLLKAAIKEIKPEKVYVVVSWQAPFKKTSSVSYADRKNMFKAGFEEVCPENPTRMVFHPFERDKKKIVYTYRTISHFKANHPRSKLFFLMGSDCFHSFSKWKNPGLILKKASLLVGRRKGFLSGTRGVVPAVFLKGFFPDKSSTKVKNSLFVKGLSADIPSSVALYIRRKRLYLKNIRDWLNDNLSSKRFNHSIETTRLALELADKHGADLNKTAIAALLHDAARDLSEKTLKSWANKNKDSIPFFRPIMDNEPRIFHPYMSAYIAREKFSVKDEDVLNAIKVHTIGSLKMSPLCKIIYVADISGRDRDGVFTREIRKAAFSDIDKAFFIALKCKLEYVIKTKKWMHPQSIDIWNDSI